MWRATRQPVMYKMLIYKIKKYVYQDVVTVILVGANTYRRKWVKYEIDQNIARGNGLLTIDISKIADMG